MTLTHYEPNAPATVQSAEPLPGANLIAWADSLSAAHRIASALCETSFVPRHFQGKPIEAAAALMLGEEIGLAPVSALRSIFIISGTPSLYAKAMVALAQSRGHEVWTEVDNPTKVVVCGRRKGSDHVERSEWTTDRARRAGYTTNKKYESDPQAMLYARAASDVCRKIAADALTGVPYTVEEMELVEAAEPVKRTARRKAAELPPETPEPDLEPAAEATEQPPDEPPEPEFDDPADSDETPGGASKAQLAKIGACMRDLGITDAETKDEAREKALDYVAKVIGHGIASRTELTKAEAHDVIERLTADMAGQAAAS